MRKGRLWRKDRPNLSRNRRVGQSTVEYFLLLSVLIMALYWVVVVSDTFAGPVQDGMEAMQDDVGVWIGDGVVGGGS
jgi:hypothetical protein